MREEGAHEKKRWMATNPGRRPGDAPATLNLVFVESVCDDAEILERNYALKMGNDDYKGKPFASAIADFKLRVKAYERVCVRCAALRCAAPATSPLTPYPTLPYPALPSPPLSRYEAVGDDEDNCRVRYIKVHNVGEKVESRQCCGYVTSQLAFFLSNVHINPRRIFLARHAETVDNRDGILGLDHGDLTHEGASFAAKLADFAKYEVDELVKSDAPATTAAAARAGAPPTNACPLLLLHGTQESHISTAMPITEHLPSVRVLSTSLLNELGGGDFDGTTVMDLKRDYPEVYVTAPPPLLLLLLLPALVLLLPAPDPSLPTTTTPAPLLLLLQPLTHQLTSPLLRYGAREADKLRFRYPGAGGESYLDVIGRLRPLIIEMERERSSALIISHLAVQRCIYAYFTGSKLEDVPYLDLRQHVVIELQIGPYGCRINEVDLDGKGFSKKPAIIRTKSSAVFDDVPRRTA